MGGRELHRDLTLPSSPKVELAIVPHQGSTMTDTPLQTKTAFLGPILVGVDDSPSATSAAAFGQHLARRLGVNCHLLHVVEPGNDTTLPALRVREALRATKPPVDTSRLEIRVGPAAETLVQAARLLGAGLLILGGKHHSLLGRWVAGSTAVSVARQSAVPVLVTRGDLALIRRIIAGADATPTAFGAVRHAEEWADLWDADLRVVHAIQLPPLLPEYSLGYDLADVQARGEAEMEQQILPLVGRPETERVVEVGGAAVVLSEQARYWQADLLVVARHDRGALDRLVLGSVTERLLDGLPTSILVVPAIGARGQVESKVVREEAVR
jgi:universal stress protein E